MAAGLPVELGCWEGLDGFLRFIILERCFIWAVEGCDKLRRQMPKVSDTQTCRSMMILALSSFSLHPKDKLERKENLSVHIVRT